MPKPGAPPSAAPSPVLFDVAWKTARAPGLPDAPPEIAALPRPETAPADPLLDALCDLLPAQLDALVFKLGVPAAFLSGASAPQATRSTEVLRWADQRKGRRAGVALLVAEVTGAGKTPR